MPTPATWRDGTEAHAAIQQTKAVSKRPGADQAPNGDVQPYAAASCVPPHTLTRLRSRATITNPQHNYISLVGESPIPRSSVAAARRGARGVTTHGQQIPLDHNRFSSDPGIRWSIPHCRVALRPRSRSEGNRGASHYGVEAVRILTSSATTRCKRAAVRPNVVAWAFGRRCTVPSGAQFHYPDRC